MKKIFLIGIIPFIIACSSITDTKTSIIRISGSDTMLKLNLLLAQEFMQSHPNISVYVNGGGSKTGINALVNNNTDICASSRPLQSSEIKLLGERFGTIGISHLVARDALSIYLNKENNVKNLSLDQVKDIFTCKITNWKDVGGANHEIIPISRNSSSGTYLYFINHVLKGENICERIERISTTMDIINIVKNNKFAIGYGGIGYAKGIKSASIDSITANKNNVLNNTYPISRYLRYYTIRKPKGNVKTFLDWVKSTKGQKIIENAGYYPLWK